MIPRGKQSFTTKHEASTSTTTTTTTTRTWSKSNDPRIVCVSRALGGKDRHSKVCTVRGLRDRRVRLSVPTAIQLYDLQDRLGLSQPSKVVDWLLNAAKHDIDELPPLQFPQVISPNFEHPMMGSFHQDFALSSSQSAKHGLKLKDNNNHHHHVSRETSSVGNDNNWTCRTNEDNEMRFNLQNNFLDRQNIFSPVPNYNSFVRSLSWDHHPPNLTLNHHQPSISLGLTAHHQDHGRDLHNNLSFLQSGPSGLVSNQVINHVYHHQQQPAGIFSSTTQPYFPQTNTEFDSKDSSNIQTSSELSNPVRAFQFS